MRFLFSKRVLVVRALGVRALVVRVLEVRVLEGTRFLFKKKAAKKTVALNLD